MARVPRACRLQCSRPIRTISPPGERKPPSPARFCVSVFPRSEYNCVDLARRCSPGSTGRYSSHPPSPPAPVQSSPSGRVPLRSVRGRSGNDARPSSGLQGSRSSPRRPSFAPSLRSGPPARSASGLGAVTQVRYACPSRSRQVLAYFGRPWRVRRPSVSAGWALRARFPGFGPRTSVFFPSPPQRGDQGGRS
jgi:hypothetical protein